MKPTFHIFICEEYHILSVGKIIIGTFGKYIFQKTNFFEKLLTNAVVVDIMLLD